MDAAEVWPYDRPRVDTCPRVLRTVLERWKRHQATPAELQEATYTVALDDLDSMGYQHPPLVPAEVVEFRALSPEAQRKMSQPAEEALAARHQGFFACERQRALDNLRNRPFLTAMLAWAEACKPQGVVLVIQQALSSHLLRDEG